jgi:toxin ParE1/3/4
VARIRYTATARSDLGEIYRYIRKRSGSGETARRFVHELRNKCEQLAAAPIQMGRTRADLRPDLRSHPDRAYVIFFRYERDVLEIVRMIDSHRDIPPLFDVDEQT